MRTTNFTWNGCDYAVSKSCMYGGAAICHEGLILVRHGQSPQTLGQPALASELFPFQEPPTGTVLLRYKGNRYCVKEEHIARPKGTRVLLQFNLTAVHGSWTTDERGIYHLDQDAQEYPLHFAYKE